MPTSTSRPRTAEGGVTLLELLVVISVLGVLLGVGAGAWGALATPDLLAGGRIKDALRTARLMARREGLPAAVVIDPAAGEVRALGLRAAGNWHFEDEAGSGWPVPARHEGARLDREGVLGSALVLADEALLAVPGLPPGADDPQGFGVEAWLAPAAGPRPMVLLERPGRWLLRLDEEDQLQVSLWLDARPAPEELRRSVPELRLSEERFTRLTVLFDGRSLHVAAAGRRCGEDTRLAAPRRLAGGTGAALGCGTGLERFRGRLDELRLFAVAGEPQAQPLPEGARLLGEPRLLRLEASGRLDPAFHAAPESVGFEWGDPPRRSFVELSPLGALREWTEGP